MLKLGNILVAAIMSLMCGFAMAQPQDGTDGGPGGPGGPGSPGRQGGPRHEMRHEPLGADFFKAINAAEDQIEKLKPILQSQWEKMKEWRESNKEKFHAAHKAMQEARESKDEGAIAKAKEQMKALGDDGKKLHEQFMKDLSTVLNEEQMAKAKKFWQNRAGKRNREMQGNRGPERGGMFAELGLTDDQKAKIKDIMTDARTKAEAAENPQEKREIMQAAFQKVNSEVLTDDQKAKLEKMKQSRPQQRPGARRPGMNPLEGIATPEQMKQAEQIMKDAHKQAEEIMKAARKKINDEVLNEEQRKALAEKMEQFKKQHMKKGGPRPGGDGMNCKDGDKPCSEGGKGKSMGERPRKQHKDMLMSILTADQKEQAQKIMGEAREKAKAATDPKEKREIMKAAREKIKTEILTDEQRKELQKQRKAKKAAPETSMAPDDDFGPMGMMEDDGPEFGPEMDRPAGPDDFGF